MFLEGKKFYASNENNEDGAVLNEARMDNIELGYWRKHPNLHGYIVQNFADGVDECQPIYLGEDRLKELIKAVNENKLIPTTGFFFGESPEDSAEYDIPILEKALDILLPVMWNCWKRLEFLSFLIIKIGSRTVVTT